MSTKCLKTECFRNNGAQKCQLLTGMTRADLPCPFFKTDEQYELDKMKSHDRLVSMGRLDLIKKFECNPKRQW